MHYSTIEKINYRLSLKGSKKLEMESNSNNLKWLCFSGLTEDYPIWSTRFLSFSQMKGLFDTLTGNERPPTPPTRLGNDPTDEARAAHDAAEAAHRRALDDIEKRKNPLWCYLAMVLDSTSLMLIRHDCVDHKGLGDGHKAWGLPQERFRSNETFTVVSDKATGSLGTKRRRGTPQLLHQSPRALNSPGASRGTSFRATAQCDGAQWFT